MGRAARWFKGLFGIKTKEKEHYTGFCHNPTTIPPNITQAEAAWLRSFYSQSDTDQNKHAIAVAAATAAAADAAVAAAQAAAAVVRLTTQGHEKWAVVKIQTVFRGYLARKALRALKGLVKIQALVRGFFVRKQAAATLHGMQALIRAQASVRARAKKSRELINIVDNNYSPQFQARKSLEKFDDTRRCEHPTSMHSRRLSASFEASAAATNAFDESPKIVEVDMGCRPKSRSRRTNTWMSDSNEDSSGKAVSSPFPSRTPGRISIPEGPNFPDQEWGLTEGEECHFSTAQSTPRIANSCSCNTPAKSVYTESYFRSSYGEHPNYMAKTQSFKAKVRSQSAPKQRPEPGPKRRLSLHEMMESRSSLSGVRMQRSCSQAQETVNFKNAVMGKLNRSSDFGS
ncbi:hypothetical protein RD792_010839 [Penstemon davidsonii]|uniref:DUF4005 domain-containing protein n=1 Tax=Penstemon davidsonii TaxID=160366 RepID=A0ABR0D4V2_9LAMI|nr:hypothetical protein RD792_010839 [Penstemon davidsonii]